MLYNSAVPESVALAKSYQKARSIPTVNLIGLEMPDREEITRQEYDDLIRKPLRDEFEKRVWWRLGPAEGNMEVAVENRMQVMVCMRGVPLKIARVVAAEAAEKKPAAAGEKPQAEQPFAVANEASVDSELSILSWSGHPLNGPLKNAFYESKQGIEEVSLPYLMLVGRVDGPNYAICERMICDAVATEQHGLWGRAYIDLAQFYPEGEAWLRSCAFQSADAG
ncbi:MAG: TIGR03790 family protein, partial [Verrucomicrobia bacterium]